MIKQSHSSILFVKQSDYYTYRERDAPAWIPHITPSYQVIPEESGAVDRSVLFGELIDELP
jgi:hypothetical protein